ncbi:hypothetical protein BB559_007240 [Furculomyces boomerangus]|uniref:Single-stranded DNA-binding protein n=2 Tax=Harpellales TaxID=61421 RepID=A0A2T9XY46_9FUNG|nr:hypothetical protein BB559_007240 [Furculomyces boomerangus]PVZ98419.1 hypothetical protein BB558_005576 [Smittium angustum]PWA02694.1 hypothetical protein BB558_001151 [Smittium angustum]
MFSRSLVQNLARSTRNPLSLLGQVRKVTSLNKVILIGNVGRDPDVRVFGDNKKVASFSLATSYSYKDAEGNILQKTNWHQVSAFSKLAELIEKIVSKGALVYIEGRIDYKQYTNKEGVEVNTTEIVADQLRMFKYPKNQDSVEGASDSVEE